jgi:hypothetical protein
MARIVSILDETISGMRVINAFNARKFLLNKVEQNGLSSESELVNFQEE